MYSIQKKFRDSVPSWAFDHKEVPHRAIVMSDDLDSLISSCMYSYITGYPILYFYDFKTLSSINPNDTRERVFIDVAVKQGKCFDNHVQRFTLQSKVNDEAINFNSIFEIWRGNYFEKFAMSTLIMLYATYKDVIALPASERGKMIVLAIDSGYLGFYDDRYKEAFIHNLKALGLDELLEVLESHTLEDFKNVSNQLNSKIGKKIYRKESNNTLWFMATDEKQLKIDNRLKVLSQLLGFPITLPQGEFETIQEFDVHCVHADDVDDLMEKESVFSFALTGQDEVKVSYMYKRDMERMKKAGA